ncbi:hypothetical protein KEM52_006046 [Ascosphaera acerosa]|nr:hypothetical protein KEM52_006046 [Ascosphaera acerosa]
MAPPDSDSGWGWAWDAGSHVSRKPSSDSTFAPPTPGAKFHFTPKRAAASFSSSSSSTRRLNHDASCRGRGTKRLKIAHFPYGARVRIGRSYLETRWELEREHARLRHPSSPTPTSSQSPARPEHAAAEQTPSPLPSPSPAPAAIGRERVTGRPAPMRPGTAASSQARTPEPPPQRLVLPPISSPAPVCISTETSQILAEEEQEDTSILEQAPAVSASLQQTRLSSPPAPVSPASSLSQASPRNQVQQRTISSNGDDDASSARTPTHSQAIASTAASQPSHASPQSRAQQPPTILPAAHTSFLPDDDVEFLAEFLMQAKAKRDAKKRGMPLGSPATRSGLYRSPPTPDRGRFTGLTRLDGFGGRSTQAVESRSAALAATPTRTLSSPSKRVGPATTRPLASPMSSALANPVNPSTSEPASPSPRPRHSVVDELERPTDGVALANPQQQSQSQPLLRRQQGSGLKRQADAASRAAITPPPTIANTATAASPLTSTSTIASTSTSKIASKRGAITALPAAFDSVAINTRLRTSRSLSRRRQSVTPLDATPSTPAARGQRRLPRLSVKVNAEDPVLARQIHLATVKNTKANKGDAKRAPTVLRRMKLEAKKEQSGEGAAVREKTDQQTGSQDKDADSQQLVNGSHRPGRSVRWNEKRLVQVIGEEDDSETEEMEDDSTGDREESPVASGEGSAGQRARLSKGDGGSAGSEPGPRLVTDGDEADKADDGSRTQSSRQQPTHPIGSSRRARTDTLTGPTKRLRSAMAAKP